MLQIMFVHPRRIVFPLLIAALTTLAACKTAEEKAEDYYQSGLSLLASGDEERAMIEFRNAFKYNGFHQGARKTYADTLVKEGKLQEAYSQYLRLVEQYPDMVDVRVTLAEMAIDRGDWSEVERHGTAAFKLAPDDPKVQVIKLALDFRNSIRDKDEAAQAEIADRARDILTKAPESMIARRILLGHLATGPDPMQALPVLDEGLKYAPKSLDLYMMKFRILAKANDVQGTGDVLKQMFTLFPENKDVSGALISWYMIQKDYDGAEAFLRKLAGAPDGPTDAHLGLVQFLQVARGSAAAAAELDSLIAANKGNPNAELYGGMRASLDFTDGKKDEGIAALQAILKTAAPSDQTRSLKVLLARMLDTTANRVGARALIEEVLAEDPANVAALKQRGAWLIDEDKTGDAIVDLRAALDQSPRDTQILTLLAAAHERDGSLDLAGDQLAKAVDVSSAAPEESLRYAQFLIRTGKADVAEVVLANARQTTPTNPDILRALVQYYVGQSKWVPAQDALDAFKALKLANTETEAQKMQATILAGQDRIDDSLSLLETIAKQDGQGNAAVMSILQTQLRAGKTAEARSYLDTVLAKSPKDPQLRFVSANLDRALGNTEAAETTYRALITEFPTNDEPVQQLYALLKFDHRDDEAAAVLAAGLAAKPQSRPLRWLQASVLEADGKIDEAIKLYEALYAEDSGSTIVANNLASLITSHYDDAANLQRAEAIARRLRGLDVPAFQDTYGWIAFRNGNLDDALSHLEPAAKGLAKDPMVQFHLARVYDKLDRKADAIRQYELALSLAGATPSPQLAEVQADIARLKAAPAP
jgi:predicted Zn-dependent protease